MIPFAHTPDGDLCAVFVPGGHVVVTRPEVTE